jgi:hypothetical protein
MGSEDESCESGITPNITGRGKKGTRKLSTWFMIRIEKKMEYSVFRNRCDERHHQTLMQKHLLDDEDQFLIFSGMTKIQLKSVSNAVKGDDTKI